MKAIIVSPNFVDLHLFLSRNHFVVVAEMQGLGHIVSSLIKLTPHLVILDDICVPRKVYDQLVPKFQSIRFVYLCGTDQQRKAQLNRAVKKSPICPPPPTEPAPSRTTILSPEFREFTDDQLAIFPRIEDSPEVITNQQCRLQWMLRTARLNLPRAESYWHTIRNFEPYEGQEQANAICQQSPKAITLARESLSRYMGVLSHFIPGTDLNCLPPPTDPNPEYRYLHYEPTLEMDYATMALSNFGYVPAMEASILETHLWRFKGQDEHCIKMTALKMAGLCQVFRTVAAAQMSVMNWFMNPKNLHKEHFSLPSFLCRTKQTFANFWDLNELYENPQKLGEVVDLFAENISNLPAPVDLAPPPFQEIVNSRSRSWNHNRTKRET